MHVLRAVRRFGRCDRRAPADFSQKAKHRGDKTLLELFLAGIRGWEAGLRPRMVDGELNTVLRWRP